MSDLGITVHAPPAGGAGFQRKSYEVRRDLLQRCMCSVLSHDNGSVFLLVKTSLDSQNWYIVGSAVLLEAC